MSDNLRDDDLTRLYRETADAVPPAALDRIILEAARAGLAGKPERRRAGWQHWTAPVAAFATIVLTVTLTLLVQQEHEQIEQALPAPAQEKAATPPLPSTLSIPAQPAAVAGPRRADSAIAPPAARAPEAAVPEQKLKEAAAPAELRPFAAESKEAVKAEARQRSEAGVGVLSAPAAPPPAAEAELRAAPAAKPAAAPFRYQAAPAAADGVDNRAKTAPLRKQVSGALEAPHSPEAWLDEIRQLRKQGREKEAQDALEAFRRAYPDYRLPEDLR
jgi:hypothetical protein